MTAPLIRALSPAEVETLGGWAANEGWNPGLADAAAFRAADPGGFLGAFVDDEMAAGISAVAYGDDFGFIGLYICRPDMRGKGYGKAVWDAGMARLAGRTVGLDGVPAQQANYRSMGFVPAYRTIRYGGRHGAAGFAPVRPLTSALLPAVLALDRSCFPAARETFLTRWLEQPRIARAAVRGGAVVGYGVARACRDGFKVGPLFADDLPAAADLLAALAAECGGDLHIDVPETQAGFAALLADAGLAPGFETARMYRGPAPRVDMGKVFGVTTLELG